MSKLVLFLADGTTLDIPLNRERMAIGRRTGNDICLPYPAVSGKHAVVVTLSTGSVLEDLGSTNGTFVNRKRVSKYFLHDHDSIDIGRQKLVYCVDDLAVIASVPRRSRATETRSEEVDSSMTRAAAPSPVAPPLPPEPTITGGEVSVHTNTTVRLPADAFSEAALSEYAATNAANRDIDDYLSSVDDAAGTTLSGPTIKVLTGPHAGHLLSLTKDETLIGRVGAQIVAVRKDADGFRLFSLEGEHPARINGTPVPPEGSMLKPGDVAEIAGAQLQFLDLESAL
jgi:pSer/pThr/pTyr-binding forkhead associated (FHA) protein